MTLGQFHKKRVIDDLRQTEVSSHNREDTLAMIVIAHTTPAQDQPRQKPSLGKERWV